MLSDLVAANSSEGVDVVAEKFSTYVELQAAE